MTPQQQRRRRAYRAQLTIAEKALRSILHEPNLDPLLRAHAERACAHVDECHRVLADPREARSVDDLVRYLGKVRQWVAEMSRKPGATGVHSQGQHV